MKKLKKNHSLFRSITLPIHPHLLHKDNPVSFPHPNQVFNAFTTFKVLIFYLKLRLI